MTTDVRFGRLGSCKFRLALVSLAALGAMLLGAATAAAADTASGPTELAVESYSEDFDVPKATAETHLEAQEQGAGMVELLGHSQGSRYAGVWFDNESGEFVIPTVGADPRATVEASLAGTDLQNDFRTKIVQYTWEELEAAHTKIDRKLLPLIEANLVQTSLDPRANAVVVHEAEATTGAERAKIQGAANDAEVKVEIKQAPSAEFEVETRACHTAAPRACDRPLRGGVDLYKHYCVGGACTTNTGECTAGFKATGFGNAYMLTAGHCDDTAGATWGSENSSGEANGIGYIEASSFPTHDWARIKVNGAYWLEGAWPSEVAHYWEDQERAITAESVSYLGEYVCHTGTMSGTSCGNVKAIDFTVNLSQGPVYHETRFGDICVLDGDSGGPVFAGNTALGLFSSSDTESQSPNCTSTGDYVEITEATDWLGVSVGPRVGATPSAITGAGNVTGLREASVDGQVDPNGLPTTYYFEYGTTAAYGSTSPSWSAGSGWALGPVSGTITGLTGPTVHFRLVASNSAGTSYGQDQTFSTPDWRPVSVALPATEVSGQGVTMNATVDPVGASTNYQFEYGLGFAYNNSVPIPSGQVGSGTSPVPVSYTISGLPDGLYNYRVRATNGDGTSYSAFSQDFEIHHRPMVTLSAASNVQSGTATLSGTINPQGFDTTYHFEYSQDSSYSMSAPIPSKGAGSGTAALPVSVELTDLQPESTYRYRLVASNAKGTTTSIGQTFETKTVPAAFESFFGWLGSGEGQFKAPRGTAVDSSGNIWVVDTENNRVQKFNSKGEYLSKFGTFGPGNGQFNKPIDIAISGSNQLWVTDSGNSRVQKFNTSGEYLSQFGVHGTAPGQLMEPWGIAMAEDDLGVWVVDRGFNRVELFRASDGSLVTEVHGAGYGGSGNAEFKAPTDIASYMQQTLHMLVVADTGNNRVQILTTNGDYWYQIGAKGVGNGQFEEPQAVATKPGGNILVADKKTGRVQQFTASGAYQTQFGGGQLSEPGGIAAITGGTVYVANTGSNRIEKWQQPLPAATTNAATGISAHQATLNGTVNPNGVSTTYRFEYGPTTSYGSSIPVPDKGIGAGVSGVAVSQGVSGLQSETSYHYRLVATNTNGVTYGKDTIFYAKAVTPVFGLFFGWLGSGDGQFKAPRGTAVDSSGNIWVVDTENNRVQKFNSKGEYLSKFGTFGPGNGQFNKPIDIAISTTGLIYVTDSGNARIQAFNMSGEYVGKFGTFGTAPGQLVEPWGIAMAETPAGVWVTDRGFNRVELLRTSDGSLVTEVHGAGYGGSGNAEFKAPTDIAKAENPYRVWIADTGNNRVQQLNTNGEYVSQFGSKGNGTGQFEEPQAIAVRPSGSILVGDKKTGRVQQFRPSGEYETQFGSGQLSEPSAITAPASGLIYVANTGANRLEKWVDPGSPDATTQAASGVGAHGATLAAVVNPAGLSTTYRFEYGKTTAYGSSTPTKSAGSGISPSELSEPIAGLAPETAYHYRVVAENAEGIDYGSDVEFKTTSAVPLATTGSTTGVAAAQATLNGVVNPNGLSTTYRFEYGKTTAYGTNVPVPNEGVGSGEVNVNVAKPISGLAAHTEYHYRLVATNEKGTVNGADRTFTTDAWSAQTTFPPDPKTEVKLESVSCASATMCMAAGKDNYASKGFSELWNGSSWSVTNRIDGEINSVSCASTTWCMTVGEDALTGEMRAFRLKQEGGVWNYETKTPPTPAGGSDAELLDVSCTSESACTAVGAYYNGTRDVTLAERWNGSTWTVQTTTNSASEATELFGVSCPTSTYCMAIGHTGIWTFAEAWNGTSWSTSELPDPSGTTEGRLQDVSCSSSTNCMAVGWFKEGSAWKKAFIERWNGSAWTLQTTPSPAEAVGNVALQDVACPSSSLCEAVGTYGNEKGGVAGEDAKTKTLAETWNGSAWSVQSSPNNAEKKFNGYAGIACSSTTSCTAVGNAGPSAKWADGTVTQGARYNGTSWSAQTTANPAPKTEVKLESVSCASATMCMAAGKDNYTSKGFSELWNGSGWSVTNRIDGAIESVSCASTTWCMTVGEDLFREETRSFRLKKEGSVWNYETKTPPTPAGGSDAELLDVSCTSESACTAVGAYYNGTRDVTLAERWNGSSWTVQTTTNPASGDTELLGVSCSTASWCMAIGRTGASTFAEAWNGTTWSTSTTANPAGGTENTLRDVSCSSTTACTASGWYKEGSAWKKALAERWNGSSWTLQSTPSPTEAVGNVVLQDVSCPSSSLCEAVGTYGNEKGGVAGEDAKTKTLAETWNGSAWSVQGSPNNAEKSFNGLNGVSCSSTTACTAAGGAGPSSGWADGTVTFGARYE